VELSALSRLKLALEAQKNAPRTPQNIQNALDKVLSHLDRGDLDVIKPRKVDAGFLCPPFASFAYLWCPLCHSIYEYRDAAYNRRAKSFECPKCRSNLVHAYVGAPVDAGARTPTPIDVSRPAPGQDYYILPTDGILNMWCKGKIKGLKPAKPHRPVYSLRRVCPHNLTSCKYYDRGFCEESSRAVYFKSIGGIRRGPAMPSESLTKPYCVAIFKSSEGIRDITDEVNKGLDGQIFDGAYVGAFRVWELTLFYLIGHSYARRSRRIPILLESQGTLETTGRTMETRGLLLKLNIERVKQAAEAAEELGFPAADEYTVAHSISHAAIKAVVRISGLSYAEFGEALLVSADSAVAEVLVYDNSPGGVGGVETIPNALAEFPSYLKEGAGRCPRLCRSACRACLYVENCTSLNFNLSWFAANFYISGGGRREQPS
jgi:hypothetical protein